MSSTLNRRAILAGAAAAPTLAVPAAASAASAVDHGQVATIARAEQLVDVLGSHYVRDGWNEAFDKERATRFVDAVRTQDDSGPVHATVTAWMRDHGQSLDWLYDGDAGGLICRAAAHSPAAMAIPAVAATPDPAIKAAAEWRRAEQEMTKAHCELSDAEFACRHDPCPDELVAWRHHRHIGGAEIEEVRDEFLATPDADKAVILKEYAVVKARYRAAQKAQREWYKAHGLSKLKATALRLQRRYWRATEVLEKARPTTIAGAVALIEPVHEFMKEGSVADFFEPVLENALAALRRMA